MISESVAVLLLLLGNAFWCHSLLFGSLQLPWYLPIDGHQALDFIGYSLAHFVADIEALRLYLISYDLNYLQSLNNERWKSVIDYSFAENDWYLTHHGNWGNKRYVFKRGAICHLIGLTIRTTYMCWGLLQPQSWTSDYIYVLDAILFCFPILLINWTYCNSPNRVNDQIFLHFEFKATIIAYIAAFVVFCCILLVLMLFSGDKNVALVLTRFVLVGSAAMPSYLSTIYIPHKIRLSSLWVCTV